MLSRHDFVSKAIFGEVIHNIFNILSFRQMLLSILKHLVDQSAWCTVQRLYRNVQQVMFRCREWFRLQRLACKVLQREDCSTAHEPPSRLDTLLSCRIYISQPSSVLSILCGIGSFVFYKYKGSYPVLSVLLIAMYHSRFRNRTIAQREVVLLLWFTGLVEFSGLMEDIIVHHEVLCKRFVHFRIPFCFISILCLIFFWVLFLLFSFRWCFLVAFLTFLNLLFHTKFKNVRNASDSNEV